MINKHICYTDTCIQPRLENKQFSGVKQEKIFFSKYTMLVTLTLLTHVLQKQIGWFLLVVRK